MTHTVKPGENLSKIAQANGITLAQLLDANPQFKADPNKVRVGDVVNIPGAQPSAPAQPQPQPQPQPTAVRDRTLGKLSAKFETGGRGPGTVSTGHGDAGGVSYGSYQMTSVGGGTVGKFVSEVDFPFRDDFKNLRPGSAEFTAKWKAIAAAQPEAFQKSQHEFIKRTHYDLLLADILRDKGLDVNTRSHTVQDVVWSTAVQHGAHNSIVQTAMGTLNVRPQDAEFDKRFISAVYAERGRKNTQGILVHFAKNSLDVQKGVANRFRDEERDALKMLQDEHA